MQTKYKIQLSPVRAKGYNEPTNNSVLHVAEDGDLIVAINQAEYKTDIEGNVIDKIERNSVIYGDMQDMLLAEFEHNGTFLGKIKVIETFGPITSSEPELYVKRNKDGTPYTINGKTVYRFELYTVDPNEPDELLD